MGNTVAVPPPTARGDGAAASGRRSSPRVSRLAVSEPTAGLTGLVMPPFSGARALHDDIPSAPASVRSHHRSPDEFKLSSDGGGDDGGGDDAVGSGGGGGGVGGGGGGGDGDGEGGADKKGRRVPSPSRRDNGIGSSGDSGHHHGDSGGGNAGSNGN